MSVDAYAGAVIGVWFEDPEPQMLKVPSCDHPARLGNAFCPVCGKKVEDVTVEDDTIGDVLDGIQDRLPPGYVFERSSEDNSNNFLGYGCEARGDGGSERSTSRVPDIDDVRKTVIGLLEGTGIYSEEAFGLHAYLHWS